MDLSVNYLGHKLKNPLIVGASNLSLDLSKALALEKAGVSAIVFKSLFEEQINLESAQLEDDLHEYDDRDPEMITLFPDIKHAGPKAHLMALKKLKEKLTIPVFASLNCNYKESWDLYASYLVEAGADALELNFYSAVSDGEKSAAEIEDKQIEILKIVKNKVDIPIAVKLSPYYTNPIAFIEKMDDAGLDSLVLFNRFFHPDIDIKREKLEMPYNLSTSNDSRLTIRYMGLLSNNVKADLCANTGIIKSEDLIAAILAGADAVQVVSTIYKNGVDHISVMIDELELWMKSKNYRLINDFKGKLSKQQLKEPFAYSRGQYVDFILKAGDYSKKYPVK
ncbi:dihydroorotate dehydrogenase-like protein [Marinilabiliaceae bacterium ANBcel2]|nr:dihydroorotate dehydrogenase-like protein [Marinilabiliaceae bacterium ANBcel2]